MADSYWYGNAVKNAFEGDIDFINDTIKCALTTSTYTPNQDTHEHFSDVTNEVAAGGGYTSGGETLGTKTATYTGGTNVFDIDAADVVWSNSTITARYAVIYKDTGTPATSPLLCYVDFASDQSSSSADFTLQFDSAGIATITVS